MQLFRDGFKMLPQQERPECQCKERQRQPLIRIDPVQFLNRKEVRDHRRFPRDHHRRNEQEEDEVPPLERDENESVGCHATDDELPEHDAE